MYSGQLELYAENNTHYYFWKFSDPQPLPENNNRTIFWFNGGPGCSSMDGALLELGPFRVNLDGKVIYNSGTWHKLADVIFVDQPAGTGFSYSDEYASELSDVAFHYVKFMEKYFELFPEEIDNDIYLAGESYAGQYIPYVADLVLANNKKEDSATYNLKGLLIGNGWIAPNEQGLSYVPYAIQAGLITTDNREWPQVLRQHEECQKAVNEGLGHEVSSNVCEQILNKLLHATLDFDKPGDQRCVNMYDYTLRDEYPSCGASWPYELSYVTPFLRKPEVMGDLNLILLKEWRECSGRVSHHLKARNSEPAVKLLPGILEQIPIVLFNGNRDIICNYIGTENFIKKLEWNGQTGFQEEGIIDWIYDNQTAGYIKTERNLTFVNVFDSSHMVPYDKPEVSRALIDLIVGNYDEASTNDKRSFVTYPIGERWDKIHNKKPEEEETTPEGDVSNLNNRLTRLIQLVVIAVLIWGIYVIYTSYTSKPPSIIKKAPTTAKSTNSQKKKNVQWADQLRRFQEDDPEFQRQKNQGFLSKTIDKLKGTERGRYAPVATDKVYEDIEMAQQVGDVNLGGDDFVIDEFRGVDDFVIDEPQGIDDFVIDSEDEAEVPEEVANPTTA